MDEARARRLVGAEHEASADTVLLATLVSLAVRVEPELLRAARLELAPHVSAAREADLWFSPLVRARGSDGLVLHPEVRRELQRRLVQDQPPGTAARAWAVLERLHRRASPALAMEERVGWALLGGGGVEGAEAELRPAVDALAAGQDGLAWWAAQAWSRLPPSVLATATAWELREAAAPRLDGRRLPVPEPPEGLAAMDLSRSLARAPLVPLRLRRSGRLLQLGQVPTAGAAAVDVPETDPLLLAVLDTEGELLTSVQLGARDVVEVDVGLQPRHLRTARGDVHLLPAPHLLTVPVLRDGPHAAQVMALADRMHAEHLVELVHGDGTGAPLAVLAVDAAGARPPEDERQDRRVLRVLVGGGPLPVAGGVDVALTLADAGEAAQSLAAALRERAAELGLDPMLGDQDALTLLATAPDGSWVAAAGPHGPVSVWDAASGEESVLPGHPGGLSVLTVAPDGALLTAGKDGVVRFRDARTGRVAAEFRAHDGAVRALQLVGTGLIATGGPEPEIRFWDAGTGAPVNTITSMIRYGVRALVATPDGRLLASAEGDEHVRLYDVASWTGRGTEMTEDPPVLAGGPSRIRQVVAGGDGGWLAAIDDAGSTSVWALPTGAVLARVEGGSPGTLAAARDGSGLAGSHDDGRLWWWSRQQGSVRELTRPGPAVRALALDLHGSWVASADADGAVRVSDLSGKLGTRVLGGHDAPVRALAATADGRLLSTGDDGTVRFWDPGSGSALQVLRRRPVAVPRELAFDRKGRPGQRQLETLLRYAGSRLAGDLVLLVHGWNVDVQWSRRLLEKFTALVREVTPQRDDVVVVGVHWPSSLLGREDDALAELAPHEPAVHEWDRLGRLAGAVLDRALGTRAVAGVTRVVQLSGFFAMENRARTIGGQGLGPVLEAVHDHAPGLRVHLVAHSMGALLASSAVASAREQVVAGLVLLQATPSAYAFVGSPTGEPGAGEYGGLASRITGPVVVTTSRHDVVAQRVVPLMASAVGQRAGPGRGLARHATLGYAGASGVDAEELALGTSSVGRLPAGGYVNVDCSAVVRDHGDILRPEIARLVLAAADLPSERDELQAT